MAFIRILVLLDRCINKRIFKWCRRIIAADIANVFEVVTRVEVAMCFDSAREILPRYNFRRIAEIHLLVVSLTQLWRLVVDVVL